MLYTLPCSPSLTREDRFDFLNSSSSEDQLFWDILTAILSRRATNTNELIDQLESIGITLRGSAKDCDYEFLRRFMGKWTVDGGESQFFNNVWPKLVSFALEMNTLFRGSEMRVLSGQHEQRKIVLSRRQVACLVVHQFLGTFIGPPFKTESFQDFRIWYSSSGGHEHAKEAYLTALFTYFERIAGGEIDVDDSHHSISFRLRTFSEEDEKVLSEAEDTLFHPMSVVYEPAPTTAPKYLGFPDGACVISANKNVGFGSTGTQEEMHVGCTPEACPIVLLTPPLGDEDVLVVQGPESMVSMTGHGRGAHLDKVLPRPTSPHDGNSQPLPSGHYSDWDERVMLFMDALELDMCDVQVGHVPDCLPGNVDRELRKAYTAFSSRREDEVSNSHLSHVVTGLWGCGVFGGNRMIKSVIQWCAASMAGVPLVFVCAGDSQCEFARDLERFVELGREKRWRVGDVLRVLRGLGTGAEGAKGAFDFLARTLDGES